MNEELRERLARAICQSRKFETGEGTCALYCMDQLGPARDRCQHVTKIHSELLDAILSELTAAGYAVVPRDKPKAKWASWGPEFNTWFVDAAKFLAKIQDNPFLWHRNFQYKYLNLRVDTREGGHFLIADRDGNIIVPDDVLTAAEDPKP